MQKATNMSKRRTVNTRFLMLWLIAAVLIVASLCVPGYAFADDTMGTQQVPQAQDAVTEDSLTDAIADAETASTEDDAIVDGEDAIDETKTEDASNEASAEAVGEAAEEAEEPTEAEEDASTTDNEPEVTEPEKTAETPEADASIPDVIEQADDTTADNQDDSYNDVSADVVDPDDASYPEPIDDEPVVINNDVDSSAEQASTNLGNDPPEQASTSAASTSDKTNIENTTETPAASTANGVSIASTQEIETASSNEIEIQAAVSVHIEFLNTYLYSDALSNVNKKTDSEFQASFSTIQYGSPNAFILDSSNNIIGTASSVPDQKLTTGTKAPTYNRVDGGYKGLLIYTNARNVWSWTYYSSTTNMPSALPNGTKVYAVFEYNSRKTVSYLSSSGSTSDASINQRDMDSGMPLAMPTWPSEIANNYNNNNTSNFQGWALQEDCEIVDNKYYVLKDDSKRHWSTGDTLWDVFVYKYGITTSSSNVKNTWESWLSENIKFVPTVGDQPQSDTFTINYHKGTSDNGSDSSDTVSAPPAATDKVKTVAEAGFSMNDSTYRFLGWATSSGKTSASDVYVAGGALASAIPAADRAANATVDLYPIWYQDSYTVTYHAGAGTGSDNTVTYHSTGSSTTDTAAGQGSFSPYAKTGYTVTFAGWSRTSGGTAVQIAAGASLAAVNNGSAPADGGAYNLYAVWTETADTFKVTYKNTGATSGSDSTVTYNVADAASTNFPSGSDQGLSKTGYDFAGWSTTANAPTPGTGLTTSGNLGTLNPGKDQTYTLYPVWKARDYTVNWVWRYNASGTPESGYSTTTTATYDGSTIIWNTIPGSAPTAGDTTVVSNVQYTFKGWYLTRASNAEWKSASGSTPLGSTQNLNSVLSAADTKTDNSVTIWGIWDSANQVSITYIENKATDSSEVTFSTVDKTYAGTTIDIKNTHPNDTGHTFLYWSTDKNDASTGTRYANPALTSPTAAKTITPTGDTKLYAIWKANTVKFALDANTTDSSVALNKKSSLDSLTKTPGQTISWTDLVTATPTRSGYDFVEFEGTYNVNATTTATFTIKDGTPNSWTVLASAAEPDGTTITLKAKWTPTVYYVRYNANPVAGDTGNTVKFWKGSTQVSTVPYAVSKENGTGADLIYTTTGMDTFGGLSAPTYGSQISSVDYSWYTFVGWGSAAGATTPINSGDSFLTLYNAQTHITDKYLDLYAIWTPITVSVTYTTEDSNKGTVLPAASTNISLAVASSGYGSTATPATPSGLSTSPYKLAMPTWTYEGTATGINFGIPTTAQMASYEPSLDVLRRLYIAGETNAEFRAHFVPKDFRYEIRVYTQQADGTYNTTASASDNFISYVRTDSPGGNNLTATYGTGSTKVNALTDVVPTTTTKLADWALQQTYGSTGIALSKLFEFVPDLGGKNEITISTDESKNVIELYYKRKTYDLAASYDNAPSTVTDAATDHLSKTSGIRWGETVALTTPNASMYNGYDFAWTADNPSDATVTASSFALNETAFANLSGTASVKGVFTEREYVITLDRGNDGGNNGSTWNSGSVAQLASQQTDSKTLKTNESLGSWVPTSTDNINVNYYFVGWHDQDDTSNSQSTVSNLSDMTNWTANKTFVALWMEKITVAYESGDLDSQNNSKAAWSSKSIKVTTVTAGQVLATITGAGFDELIGSVDSYGKPKGADGWEFDYWEYKNAPSGTETIYGHKSAYNSTHQSYIYGNDSVNGISVSNSITLVAHWKAKPVSVTVNNAGAVANNYSAYAASDRVTISGNPVTAGKSYGSQSGTSQYYTDDEVDLADYTPATTPAGYQLVGWTTTDGGTTKTYATNAKVRLGTTAVELWPVFDENTVTFTYQLDSASAGRSSFATETDTVYVVKHNGVTAHTITVSDTHAYKFDGWKLDAEAASGFEITNATIDQAAIDAAITAGKISALDYTQNHTFYAHISKQKYTVTFVKPGKFDDGTDAPTGNGASVKNGTAGAGVSNDITVEWGDTIPDDSLDLVVPLGYVLAGWFEGDSSTSNVSYGSGALEGIYQYAITDDIRLHPHFTVDTVAQFKVVYDYNEAAGVGTHQADKTVIWTASVLPDSTSDQNPAVPGYTFDGWFLDDAFTKAVSDTTGSFDNVWVDSKADKDETNKTLTIHAKFSPKTYTVNFDINGGDSGAISPKPGVKWTDAFGDSSNGFKPADPTRNGYTFGGWTVSWSDGTETWDNGGAVVADTDTYAKLSKNGADKGVVTLVAKWNAQELPVTYNFADGVTPDYTGNFEWDRDYNYLLAYANPAPSSKPTRTGYEFDGWTVTYTTAAGTQTAASVTETNPTTSIKTMVGGVSGWSNLTLTANWKQIVNWHFQDVLVDRDGTEHNGDTALSQTGLVGGTIKHADSYTPHPANHYEGYDFDKYVAVLGTTHPAATADEVSLPVTPAGTDYEYKVYYIERAYDIVFRTAEGASSAYGTTNDNPWTSANATLPGTDPTQTGKTFDGWYVKRSDGTEYKLDSTLAAALSTAPAVGTQIEAYAKWVDDTVTISWSADSNGNVANATTAGSSATRTATDTGNAVGAITATPNTNYEFEKWVYSTDGGTTWQDVTTASDVATLSNPDSNGRYTELTPIPFQNAGETQAIWHNIAFKAQFVGSGSMNITIEHYRENANWKTGDAEADRWVKTETTGTSGDGDTFTATPQTFAGYTFDNTVSTTAYGATRETGTTWAADATSRVFRLYYTADPHEVKYRYVLASDHTLDQTAPSGAPLLPTTGSAKTGQNYDVAATPTFAGWEFSGWYESTNYGGTKYDGTSATMGTTDVEYVGTWKRLEKSVTFTNGGHGQVTMSPTSGYTVSVGDKVKTAVPAGNPETLQGLGVSYGPNGEAITLAGWDVFENGVKTSTTPLGISDPLDFVVNDVTEFRAVWSETFNVQYTRGAHGTFTDKNTTTVTKVEYVKVAEHTPWSSVTYEARGTVDTTGDSTTNPNFNKPNAADGWTFVGWGSHDASGNWTYYFDYDADVVYGSTTVSNYGTGTAMPSTVEQNWEFIAFFKPQERTLVFSNEMPLSPHGDFTPAAVKKLADADYTMTVKTGEKPTLLGTNSLERAGYTLVGWRTEAGGATYLPSSSDTFVMPELPLNGSVTLYPVFSLQQVDITYGVDDLSKTGTAWWGGVSNTADTIRNESDTIAGSIATANNGYVFKYWYKKGDASKTAITDATFDSATGKLTPTESGDYLAVFEQKTYTFKYVDAYGSEDVTTYPVTLPTDPANAVWTDSVTIGSPTRAGFDFQGWDVYDARDWNATTKNYDTTQTGAVAAGKLRNVRAAGTYQVSQITDVAGNQQDLILVAVWAKEALHVLYDANGGDWSNDASKYPSTETLVPTSTNVAADAAMQYNTEVGDPITVRTDATISLAGQRLVGWKYVLLNSGAEVAGSEQFFYLLQADLDASTETTKHLVSDGFTMPTQSVKLVAIWTGKSGYRVTFDLDDANATSAPADVTNATWNQSIDLKNAGANPTNPGKTFLGWTIKNSAGTVLGGTNAPANYVTAATMAFNLLAQNDDSADNAHLTLVANWEDKVYTVTFDVNGGNASAKPNDYTATDNLQWDDSVTLQKSGADPTYDGRTFAGWKVLDKNGNAIQSAGADLVVAANTASKLFSELALADTDDTTALKLVAQWTEVTGYTVTFVPRPASDTATDAITHVPADVTSAANLKWSDSVNAWENGTDAPARAGYTFNGWDVYKVDPTTAGATAIGTVAAADAATAYSAMADSDQTMALWLVAKWTEIGDYSVTFLPGDSAGATKVTMSTMPSDRTNIAYATTGISTAAPTRPGYTFNGWKSSVAGADVAKTTSSIDYKTLAGNDASVKSVTLTADWVADTLYQVTYANGVTTGKPFTGTLPTPNPRTGVTYDATDIANPDLSGMRAGYDFAGWKVTRDDTGAELTTITSNYATNSVYSALAGNADITAITFTAQWTPKGYGVTYHLSDGTWQTANITDIPSGGTADTKVPVNVDVTYNVRAANTATRAGYSLAGWQTGASGGTRYEYTGTPAFVMPAADVDLYPIWKAIDYAVHFLGNETQGTATSMPSDVDPIEYEDIVTYSAPDLTGYNFQGWNVYKTADWTSSGASATALFTKLAAGSDTYKNLAGDPDIAALTFVAQWDAKSFYVQYHSGNSATETVTWDASKIAADAMGALNNPDNPVYYKTGSTVNMRGQGTLATNGKRLMGWKDGTDAGATEYLFASTAPFSFTMPADNVNLYPIWGTVTDYTVAFENGLSRLDSTKVATGATVQNMPATPQTGLSWTSSVNTQAPSLAGWKFKGWVVYDNATPKAVIGGTDASPKQAPSYTFNNLALADLAERHDLTLVAAWEIDARYEVTFLDGVPAGETAVTYMPYAGEAVPYTKSGLGYTDDVDHGAAKRPGYRFDGWSVKAYGVSGAGIDLADVAAGTTAYYLLTGTAPGNPAYVRLELTANWTIRTYAVHFQENKPAEATDALQVVSGMPYAAEATPYTKSGLYWTDSVDTQHPSLLGYDFAGWVVKDAATLGANTGVLMGTTYTYDVLAVDDEILELTLVAQWDPKTYYVTYHSGSTATESATWHADKIAADAMATSGDPDDPVAYKTGSAVNMRGQGTLAINGKRLMGWKNGTDASATEYLFASTTPFSFAMPPKDVDLYPIWTTVDDYTVSFEDGISALDPAKVAAGATALNMPYASEATPFTKTGLMWVSDVNTQAPSLAGWKFTGWTVYDSGTPAAVIGGTDASPKTGTTYAFGDLALADLAARHDLTLVANWELVSDYVVTFLDGVLAGETTPVTTMPYAGEAVPYTKSGLAYTDSVDHSAAKRAGYTFDGWSVKAYDASGAGTDLSGIVAAGTSAYYLLTGAAPGNPAYVRLELTAKWTPKTVYNVTFKDKPDTDTGATAVVGLPSNLVGITWEYMVNAGTASAPVAPTRPGYTFNHWAIQNITDPANVRNIGRCGLGDYQYSAFARTDNVEHVLLTAVWVAHTWTVTYVDESGEGAWNDANIPAADKAHPGANAGTYAVDETVAVRGANVMSRTGYDLAGWATSSANALAGVADAADFIMPDNDVKLFAVWEPRAYTVHFLENKPAAAIDALQVVNGMPYATEATPLTKTDLHWTDTVNTQNPSLAGYVFTGWVVKDAAVLGAKTGVFSGSSYTYDELALDDDTRELTLVALWEADTYRVIYVDPTDANGAAAVTQIVNRDDMLWNDGVAIDDPYTLSSAYSVKNAADWQFNGWTITLADGSIVKVLASDDLSYAALAARTGLTVADVATATDVPALVLTADWTRRVPFVVDFVKVAADGTRTVVAEDAETLMGLDGDDVARVWANDVLSLGDGKSYIGYAYNRASSTPNVVGTLAASQLTDGLLHVQLLFEAITDYVVNYEANGTQTSAAGITTAATGAYLVGDPTRATSTKTVPSPAWESEASGFAPANSEWAKTGFRLDHWYYVAADGSQKGFDAAMTFAQIAEAIYGTVDGTEGLSTVADARPVTLYAAWVERNDYKVVYDDNYTTDFTTKPNGAGYINGKFIPVATGTPSDKDDVAWTSADLEPTDANVIVEPGRNLVHDSEGNLKSLYELVGWNYSTDGGTTQFAAEGKTFAEIAHEIYGDNEPENATIRLYARWNEIDIQLKYQPRNVKSDENGNLVLEGGKVVLLDGAGNGTVSIGSETVAAVTGNRNATNPKLIADGATATAAPGYHFVGWMRESDGTIVYVPGMDPATMSTMSVASVNALFAMAAGDGMNVLPSSIANAMTAFQAEQNTGDGYWHDETYLALFAANAIAVLKYDKNADDATGEIADVEEPAGTLLTLSDGSGFTRTYWTLTGWNTEADGTGTDYKLSESNWELPEGTTTLYAMWKKNLVKLTYDPGSDDVTGIPEDQTDEWGNTVKTSDVTPKRPHYTFKGWNTAEDGTGEWIEGGTEIELLPEGIKLYAQWDLNSYEVGGGEPSEGGKLKPVEPIEIEHGGYLPEGYLVAEPDEGYHLSGWRYVLVDEDGRTWTGVVSDPSELPITGDVTFTPIFEEDEVEETGTTTGQAASALPNTGDGVNVIALVASAVAAFTVLLLLVLVRRRKEEDEA